MTDRTSSSIAMEALVTALVVGGLAYAVQPLLSLPRDWGLPITLAVGMAALTLWQGETARRRARQRRR